MFTKLSLRPGIGFNEIELGTRLKFIVELIETSKTQFELINDKNDSLLIHLPINQIILHFDSIEQKLLKISIKDISLIQVTLTLTLILCR